MGATLDEITYILTGLKLQISSRVFSSSCPTAASQLITAAVMDATLDDITGLNPEHLIEGIP